MSNNKAPNTFNILTTADGSPTLSLGGGEKMHSMAGALSESLHIYSPCIEMACQSPSPRILSMGLGLAYNELIALCLFKQKHISSFKISSFEKVDFLTDSLLNWINQAQSPLSACYQQIAANLTAHFSLNPGELLQLCRDSINNHSWTLNGPITVENKQGNLFNGILYDAFSSGTNQELWSESFLLDFIQNYCDTKTCYFSTYAATGNLKRSLKEKGFFLEKKAGFANKRESTFARRID